MPTIDGVLLEKWQVSNPGSDEGGKALERIRIEEGLITDAEISKKATTAKRQQNGFIFMAVGAFLGFVSCVLTLVNPIPELYHIILYGLTSIAIIIIFIGLYLVFEG